MFNFFLCELPLILTVSLNETKKTGIVIFAGGPRYRNWMRLVSWVRRSLGHASDGHTEKLIFFSVSGIFSGKAESVTLLGF